MLIQHLNSWIDNNLGQAIYSPGAGDSPPSLSKSTDDKCMIVCNRVLMNSCLLSDTHAGARNQRQCRRSRSLARRSYRREKLTWNERCLKPSGDRPNYQQREQQGIHTLTCDFESRNSQRSIELEGLRCFMTVGRLSTSSRICWQEIRG